MFTKLIHFAKMSWMLYWRMLILGGLFFSTRYTSKLPLIALAIAAVAVFVFNRTLLTWPILRLFTNKRLVIPADSWGSEATPVPTKRRTTYTPRTTPRTGATAPTQRGPLIAPAPSQLATATANGKMTGFEPRALAAKPVPNSFRMNGRPGAGLHSAVHMSQTNIKLGVQGEENFARALSVAGLLNRFSTTWSVPVPAMDKLEPGKYDTDIDCVLTTGSAIFLVDLKNYKSGDVRYYHQGNQLYCEDVATGFQVGSPKTMTRNMEMATQAMRNHFPKANIVPVVVFMPTDKGEGVIDNVVWPGNIPAMNLTDFLAVLGQQGDFDWNKPHSRDANSIARFSKASTAKTATA